MLFSSFDYHLKISFLLNMILAYRPATRTFLLALRGYSSRFAPSGFTLRTRISLAWRSQKFSKKKSVSLSTQNALKRVKMQKKFCPLLTHYALRT